MTDLTNVTSPFRFEVSSATRVLDGMIVIALHDGDRTLLLQSSVETARSLATNIQAELKYHARRPLQPIVQPHVEPGKGEPTRDSVAPAVPITANSRSDQGAFTRRATSEGSQRTEPGVAGDQSIEWQSLPLFYRRFGRRQHATPEDAAAARLDQLSEDKRKKKWVSRQLEIWGRRMKPRLSSSPNPEVSRLAREIERLMIIEKFKQP